MANKRYPQEFRKQLNTITIRLETIESKIKEEKRWLNIGEASHYLGYSKDHLHKLKNEHFIESKHYHKKAGHVIFDKIELDNWVTLSVNILDPKQIANELLYDLE
jgi:hypothetical protein